MKKTIVMIPTYNERENIRSLVLSILALRIPGQELSVLVVDDNSPDGTGQAVAELSAGDDRVHLMRRTLRRGRGNAGIDGFREALSQGCDYIVEMDGDFSHHPRYIPDLIAAAEEGADVVVGSRFVSGGADKDRGYIRQLVTRLAGFYVRGLLGVKIRDVSSGYRCFKRRAIEQIDFENLISTGPSVVLEILFKCVMKGMIIREVPIEFMDRRQGQTKLDWVTLLETMVMVLRLRDLRKRQQL